MRVAVQLFAVARQLAGRDRVEVELPAGATVAQLREQLGRQLPALEGLLPQMLFAVAAQYADDQTPIPPEAEVACIPPVSGG